MVKREFYDENKTISIALRGEGPGQCDKPFYSKESLESQYHPYLRVNYTPQAVAAVPALTTIGLVALIGLLGVIAVSRIRRS